MYSGHTFFAGRVRVDLSRYTMLASGRLSACADLKDHSMSGMFWRVAAVISMHALIVYPVDTCMHC